MHFDFGGEKNQWIIFFICESIYIPNLFPHSLSLPASPSFLGLLVFVCLLLLFSEIFLDTKQPLLGPVIIIFAFKLNSRNVIGMYVCIYHTSKLYTCTLFTYLPLFSFHQYFTLIYFI